MNKTFKTVLLSLSLAINAICAAFVISALSRGPSPAITFTPLEESGEGPPITAAAIVTCDPSCRVELGPVTLNMKPGARAAVQFSAWARSKQADWIVNTIYDRAVISVENSPTGTVITALRPGEAVMQALTENGFTNVAIVRVSE